MTIIELVLSLAAILLAAVLFVNAVEIFGDRMQLGQGAVGSILAAVGTALPETMIPVVAIVGALITGAGASAASDIGVGAILGAPFLLATLAMFVVGASALFYRGRRDSGSEVVIDRRVAHRDMGFFFVFFALAAGAGIVALPFLVKILVALVLLGAYALYVRWTLQHGGEDLQEVPQKLRLWPGGGAAPTWAVVAQLVGSLVVMAAGAHFFVVGAEHVSTALGIPAILISLILAPLATELPEKFNSVIWLRDNKDTLAFGNITGAMVFQSTIPVTLGLMFTPWQLTGLSVLSVVLALVSGGLVWLLLGLKRPIRGGYLLGGGIFYLIFVVAAITAVVAA